MISSVHLPVVLPMPAPPLDIDAKIRTALVPYKALMINTSLVVEEVLASIYAVESVQAGDVNPHFLNRLTSELLHRRMCQDDGELASEEAPPLGVLQEDQQLAAFLTYAGYSLDIASELLGWSPRRTKNLLLSARKHLNLRSDSDLLILQLRYARRHQGTGEGCLSSAEIWSCAHGETEEEPLMDAIAHSVQCGRCSELWLLGWKIEPVLDRSPLSTRSITEDMRNTAEPKELPTEFFQEALPIEEQPSSSLGQVLFIVLIVAALAITLWIVTS
jgi:hypothetical protein